MYFQSRNRDTDIENKHAKGRKQGWGGRNWELGVTSMYY